MPWKCQSLQSVEVEHYTEEDEEEEEEDDDNEEEEEEEPLLQEKKEQWRSTFLMCYTAKRLLSLSV